MAKLTRLGLSANSVAIMMVLALMAVLAGPARAQTFSVIYNFSGGQGGVTPQAGLTIDAAGNLYGTTAYGGDQFCLPPSGCGAVFRLSHQGAGWIFTPLYTFRGGDDGARPFARVVFGLDGTLYGTTFQGGGSGCGGSGCGTVFNLRPPTSVCKAALCPWTETVLHRFAGGGDGTYPYYGDLVFDHSGSLYGTTAGGGSQFCNFTGCGTVYELTHDGSGWTESILYRFRGGTDGAFPRAGVIFDDVGNLYGTAASGGGTRCGFFDTNCGTVYELQPGSNGWTETTLYLFRGGSDGYLPIAGLILDRAGNLYGASATGGPNDGGAVFELTFNGGWAFNEIYDLPSGPSTFAGGPSASLTMDAAGNLYRAPVREQC